MFTWICLNYWPPKIIDDEFYFYFFIVIKTIFFSEILSGKFRLSELHRKTKTVQIINATNFQHIHVLLLNVTASGLTLYTFLCLTRDIGFHWFLSLTFLYFFFYFRALFVLIDSVFGV